MAAVYTRTGDGGDTGLFGGARVAKQSLRVEAYGAVDEANTAIGMAKATLPDGDWKDRVHDVQLRLFTLAGELASDADGAQILAGKIADADITSLERLIDDCLDVAGVQRSFVVPGRDERSGLFHWARTVVRRAERRVLTLTETEPVRAEVIQYLNRLSDAVYALARLTEHWADMERIEQIVRRAVRTATGAGGAGGGISHDVDPQLARAKGLLDAGRTRALEMGVPMVLCVVDAAGNIVALERMADSLLASIELAQGKAWTSAAFRQRTEVIGAQAVGGGPLPGLSDSNQGRVVLFGGGAPLFVGDTLLGGFGVSGGTVEEDIVVVDHAMRTVMGVEV
ncbi:MAG: cob(I)yrinic acid a,c-diamide adenosyltransferase [Propionibacterium sp.]|nr:cob(I)yrinic acid a,c-diamide adenosyltransferase [Propionibacterium sp.]